MDNPGKEIIKYIVNVINEERFRSRIIFLEDYDINVARYLVQGVDVWLNTPVRPMEASGTSGMKAAVNGVLNFSVLDGWWREAYNGQNGWAIGEDAEPDAQERDEADAESLYETLENEIIPLYYKQRSADGLPVEWLARVKESIRTLAPQFSMRRMVMEYMTRYYVPAIRSAMTEVKSEELES